MARGAYSLVNEVDTREFDKGPTNDGGVFYCQYMPKTCQYSRLYALMFLYCSMKGRGGVIKEGKDEFVFFDEQWNPAEDAEKTEPKEKESTDTNINKNQ